jgi:intron-binding protein aquarius
VLSIARLALEKAREGVDAWAPFGEGAGGGTAFAALLQRVLDVAAEGAAEPLPLAELGWVVRFLTHCFASLEVEAVRAPALRLVSLPLWTRLNERAAAAQLADAPQLAKHWKHLCKKEAKLRAAHGGRLPADAEHERSFLPALFGRLAAEAEALEPHAGAHADADAAASGAAALEFVQRALELLIDLLAQLPTRRFLRAVVDDERLLVRCRAARAFGAGVDGEGGCSLYRQLVELACSYHAVALDEQRGVELTEAEVSARRCAELARLQRVAFAQPALHEFALLNLSAIDAPDALRLQFSRLSAPQLGELCQGLDMLADADAAAAVGKPLLVDALVARYARQPNRYEAISRMPLYPTEAVLWDPWQVPRADAYGDGVLALPKLNLQFLTLHDYLLRNFTLFRLEASHEVKEDLEDAVRRMQPYREPEREGGGGGEVGFRGWARMAVGVQSFRVYRVAKPLLGESQPAEVRAEIVINLRACKADVAAEWEQLRRHDVIFLVGLEPADAADEGGGAYGRGAAERAAAAALAAGASFGAAHGVSRVRGCEIVQIADERGNWRTGESETDKELSGSVRKLEVLLDAAQYHLDAAAGTAAYAGFSLLVRRKPAENNFKAVLASIRALVGAPVAVPGWLHDVLLGYGDPAAASYGAILAADAAAARARGATAEAASGGGGGGGGGVTTVVDFFDTFLDEAHVAEAFPQLEVLVEEAPGAPLRAARTDPAALDAVRPPFKIELPLPPAAGAPESGARARAIVRPYALRAVSPYPQLAPRMNPVRFTAMQLEAIRAAQHRGLTLVVGPPGTGKTDTAVQIIANLCHAFPQQRTLVIAHSNQALNDIFAKVAGRELDERYLLRLGHGEEELATAQDFSKRGRVNYMLTRRLALLVQVEGMAEVLGVATAAGCGYTCESAGYFYHQHILARWEAFTHALEAAGGGGAEAAAGAVAEAFPFAGLFADAPQPLFARRSYAADLAAAEVCYAHLRAVFAELDECRAFELLRNSHDRGNYLLTKHARVIAMTCTHAALKRAELLDLGFQYDNLLMEEAAQVLEIETFIPLVLQAPDAATGASRLQRVVLIGDHHQLPPVVKNAAFQKYSKLDQSLFARLVRLGVPTVELNQQGRARAGLADLYRWRYKALGDLPAVHTEPRFLAANGGFAHVRQLVHVGPFRGQGESTPVAHFFQNLGEAEYVIATYMYMRLLGYAAERISIITPYNGQRALLQDIANRRCGPYAAFGLPAKIATTDKFQGQQNDFILLSLVRCDLGGRARGHAETARRSRARGSADAPPPTLTETRARLSRPPFRVRRTKHVGHIRDVRRLVVSVSRARLGLLVFCDRSLYEPCAELRPAFSQLLAVPDRLALLPHETCETQRLVRSRRARARPRRLQTGARARARARSIPRLTRTHPLAACARRCRSARRRRSRSWTRSI